MLSDFYRPSPLPPLPFGSNGAGSKDVDVDDLLFPCDDLSSPAASLFFLEQPALFAGDQPSSQRGTGGVHHHLLLGETQQPPRSFRSEYLGLSSSTLPSNLSYGGGFPLYGTPNMSTSTTPGGAATSAEPGSWNLMHPGCPGCVATASHPVVHGTGSGGGAAALSLPLLPGSAGGYGTSDMVMVDSSSSSSSPRGDPTTTHTSPIPTSLELASSSTGGPGMSVQHSWEGSCYLGPVLRSDSPSPVVACPPMAPAPALSFDASGSLAASLSFGCDESFDGSIYSWPSSASSPALVSQPQLFLRSDSPLNGSQPFHPQAFLPSAAAAAELLPCADMSPSGAVLMGTAASPLSTSSLSSSPVSGYPYAPTSVASVAPWFSSSPPSASFMPLQHSSSVMPFQPAAAMPSQMFYPFPPAGALPVPHNNNNSGSNHKATTGDVAQKRKRSAQQQQQQVSAAGGRPGPGHICTECGASKTPEWRRGPYGPRTLCNACGLRYAKRNKKKKEEDVANGSTTQPTPTAQSQALKPRSRTSSPVPSTAAAAPAADLVAAATTAGTSLA